MRSLVSVTKSLALTLFLLSFLRRKKLRREGSRPKNGYPQPKHNGDELSLDYGVSTLTLRFSFSICSKLICSTIEVKRCIYMSP